MGTTIVTFLMVFLIQKTQNKDAIAIHIKLNELVAANEKASNRIVSVEDLTEEELHRMNEYYTQLSELTKNDQNQKMSRSIEDARHKKRTHTQKAINVSKQKKSPDKLICNISMRPIWSGSINFGLVNIRVKLFSTV